MQTYQTRRKAADRGTSPRQNGEITRSDMLHLSGAGAPQPISPMLREKFEPGFQADFSNIRISRGRIPDEMGVQAVAQGTDILLDSRAGMDVLGHELAHVVQQAQGRVQGGFPVVRDASLEHEADVMGARAVSGLPAQMGGQAGFGGEAMAISPMSGASAPAQCKSKDEKALEQAKKQSTAEMNDPARKAREEQTLNAYGQKLRADVTQKSSGVTASTPAKSLLTGNRLNYMRSDEKDPEKDAARAVRNQAMRVPSLEMVQHMNQSVQDPANRSQSIKSLANGAKDLPDTPEIRAARSKAVDNIRLWLGMLRDDPRAMEHYQMQRDRVFAPMGDFDANTNKGGIVGGSRHAGLYALNDMFLRGTAKELYDDSRKHRDSEGNTNAIGHAIIDRTSDMMAMMNAVFAKTGNLQDMDEQERTVYDMMMAMDAPAAPAAPAVDPYGGQTHGARPTASSGSDWSRMTPQDWMAVAPSQTYDGPDPGKKKKWYQFWK